MIQLVFAHSGLNFGSNDGMPWPHITEDFKNFKERTLNTSLIMGANTFASLPTKLPKRSHYVLVDHDRQYPITKDGFSPDIPICKGNLKSILSHSGGRSRKYSVIGGVKILEMALPYADVIYKTEIVISNNTIEATTKLSEKFLEDIEKLFVVESRKELCDRDGLYAYETKYVKRG